MRHLRLVTRSHRPATGVTADVVVAVIIQLLKALQKLFSTKTFTEGETEGEGEGGEGEGEGEGSS